MSDPSEPESGYELVLSTAEVGLLPVVRSVLHGAGIPFVVQGEHALAQLPAGALAGLFARRGLEARVLVPAEHADAARALLQPAAEALAADDSPAALEEQP